MSSISRWIKCRVIYGGAELEFDLCFIALICVVIELLISNETAPESSQEDGGEMKHVVKAAQQAN